MNPSDIAINTLLNDDEYRERNQARSAQASIDTMRAGRALTIPPTTSTDPLEILKATSRQERAARVAHQMDLGIQAGPDAVKSRLDAFEATGDPSGERVPKMTPLEKANRTNALAKSEKVLSFFELHPEAAALAADDASLLGQAGKAIEFLADRVTAPVSGFKRGWLGHEAALIQFRISELETAVSPSPERDQELLGLRAEQRRLRKEMAKVPVVGDGQFSLSDPALEIFDEGLAGIGDMFSLIGLAGKGATKKTAAVVPVAFGAGFGVGSLAGGIATAPVAGAGTVPGGLALGTSFAIGAGTRTFGVTFTSEMAKIMTGHRLNELHEEGWREGDPATLANAMVYGVSAALIERLSLGIEWQALGRPLSGWSPQIAKALGVRVGNWVTSPGVAARIGRVVAGIGVASTTEAFEEILQGTFSKSLGTEVGMQVKGRPVEEVWSESLAELEKNLPQALEEGAAAAVSVALLGGLFSPLSIHREGKAVRQAVETEQFLDAWADGEAASTLAKRSPRLAGEFLGMLTSGTDRSHVYVDPAIFQDALNSEGISAIEAEEKLPGITEQIQLARETGRRVAIPSKDFARAISNSNLMPKLRAHIVGTPDPTALSNTQRIEAQQKSLEEMGLGDLAAEKDDVLAVQRMLDDSAGVVGMRIAEQLIASGRVAPAEAEVNGQLVSARVRSLAAQMSASAGRLFTPEEVFDLYPLDVLSKQQVEQVRAGTPVTGPVDTLEQDELDDEQEAPDTTLPDAMAKGGPSFAEQHVLATQRQKRAVSKKVTWASGEQATIQKSVDASLKDDLKKATEANDEAGVESVKARAKDIVKRTTARVRAAKLRFPARAKWLPLVFSGMEAKLDDDGNPVLGRDGKPVMDIVWKKIPYSFDRDAAGKALVGEARAKAVRSLAASTLREVQKIAERAKRGDREARVILRQADWYRAMRARLRHEFGGLGDLFANLLGALSPKTPVKANWKNAITALHAATAGEFDELMPKWEAWQNEIDEAEIALRGWVDGQIQAGWSVAALKRTPQFQSLLREMSELRKLPDELNPRKPNGAKYGSNGRQVVKAMVGLWRVVKDPDPAINRGSTKPKAQNFSGNLIGYRQRATIDVWAARFLQRLRWGNKVPPAAEGAVAGEARADGNATGPFGFGQDVFTAAVALIRADADLQQLPELQGINDDDLQALVWFIEKELWAQDDATTAEGEGGSFEFEADLTGSSQQDWIEDLRQIMNAKDSTVAEKLAASAELDKLKRTVDRFIAGLSLETSEGTQGVAFVPDDAEMAAVGAQVRDAILAADPDTKIVGLKVASTVGLYGAPERSFDLEAVTTEGFNPNAIKRPVWETAKNNLQDSAFVSRVLRAEEDIDYARHRPGVEVFFSETKPMEEIEELLGRISEAVGGYTVIVDALRSRVSREGGMPPVVGIRAQYIPEFDARYGDETLVGANDAQIATAMEAKATEYTKKLAALISLPGVSMAQVVWHETDVRFEGEYDAALKEIDDADTARGNSATDQGAGEGRFGRTVADGVAAAARRAADERARREAGASLFDRPAQRSASADAARAKLDEVLNQESEGAVDPIAGRPVPDPIYGRDLVAFDRLFGDELAANPFLRRTIQESVNNNGDEDFLLKWGLQSIQGSRRTLRQFLEHDPHQPLRPMDERVHDLLSNTGWEMWQLLLHRAAARAILRRMRSAGVVEGPLYRGVTNESWDWGDKKDAENPVGAGKRIPEVGEIIDLGGLAGFAPDKGTAHMFGATVIYRVVNAKALKLTDYVSDYASENEHLVSGPFEVVRREPSGRFDGDGVPIMEILIRQLTAEEIMHQGDGSLEAMLGLDQPFDQRDGVTSMPRAQIVLQDQKAYVAMLQASDASTFPHELMHWMLQQMVVLRRLGMSTPQMDKDLDLVTRWTNAESWQALTRPLADRVFAGKADKPHEIVSRGFEVFLMEGRAPSAELQPLFVRLRGWVRQVYGGVLAAKRKLGIELDDDMRRFYDRLFLIESALEEAGVEDKPIITAKPAEWTDAQWERYQTLWAKRTNAAFAHVTKKHLPAARRNMAAQKLEAIEMFRAEAERIVAEDPGWQAMEFLKRSDDGQGLDRAGLEQILGPEARGLIEAVLARPSQGRGRKLITSEGTEGLDPEWVAEAFGFRSAGDLIEGILQARTVEQHVQERINRELEDNDAWSEESVLEDAQAAASLDREALALVELSYLRQAIAGGPALDDAREAQARTGAPAASDAAAQVNDARTELMEAIDLGRDAQAIADIQARVLAAEAGAKAAAQTRKEGRAAGQVLREIEARLTAGALRRRARFLVGEVKANDLKRERAAWNSTALKAARQARKLVASRSFADAAVAIERELMAHYAAEELNRLIDETARGWKLIDRLRKSKTLQGLRSPGFDGAEQIVAIFQRYDLRRARPGKVDGPSKVGRKLQRAIEQRIRAGEVESLATFVSRLENERAEVLVIPPWMLADSTPTHWSEMSITDFLGLIDALRNIETVSRAEVKDRNAKTALSLQQAKDLIVGRLFAVNDVKPTDRKNRPNPLSVQQIQDMAAWGDALLLRVADWSDFAGGDDIENNHVRNLLVQPIVDGEFQYIELMETLLQPWLKALDKLDAGRMNSMVVIPEMTAIGGIDTLRISEILMMGLHTGTESNLDRLYEGFANSNEHQWSRPAIDAALAKLTDDEWKVIQEIWDAFDALWPRLEQHHFDRTGIRSEKLEHREFVSPTGRVMKGGYMPAKYDPKYSTRAKAIEDKAAVQGLLGHNYTKAEVQHGHLKSRAQNYSAPLDLNINVIPRHLDSVVYDLAMRKPVSDVYKLLNHPEVQQAIRKTWSRHHLEALNMMVNDAARVRRAKQQGLLGGAEAVSNWIRSGVVYTGLAYRISTGVLQLTGLLPILGEVGPKWTTLAVSRAMSNGVWPFVQRARESSVVLRRRAFTRDRELTEMTRTLDGKNRLKAKVDANTGIFIVIGDAVVSSIAWDAQRMKSMHEHGDMARAIREADRAIVRTQGSSTVGEVSALMRAEGFAKWLTLFGGFMSNIYARERRMVRLATGKQATIDVDGKPVRKVRPVAATWLFATTLFLPAVLDALVRGDGPDDDDESKLLWALSRVVSFMAAPIPLVREVVDSMMFPERRSFQGKASHSRMLELPAQVVEDLSKAFDEDEEFELEEATRSIMLGLTMGRVAPLSQAEIWVDNFWAGEEMGSARDLIWRKPIERRE